MGPIEDQGSYEEDERLVPSPQRRKEQNRAAYASAKALVKYN